MFVNGYSAGTPHIIYMLKVLLSLVVDLYRRSSAPGWACAPLDTSWSRSECSETFESILVLECSETFVLILVLGDLAISELTLTPESLELLNWPQTSWPCPSSFMMSLTTTGTTLQIPGKIRGQSWVLAWLLAGLGQAVLPSSIVQDDY